LKFFAIFSAKKQLLRKIRKNFTASASVVDNLSGMGFADSFAYAAGGNNEPGAGAGGILTLNFAAMIIRDWGLRYGDKDIFTAR